jgi:hypothetical protein
VKERKKEPEREREWEEGSVLEGERSWREALAVLSRVIARREGRLEELGGGRIPGRWRFRGVLFL